MTGGRRLTLGVLALAAVAALAVVPTARARAARAENDARLLVGGDPAAGRTLIRQYGCGSCHTIPGVGTADGRVGPPLVGIAGRAYIAGVVENTPENMQRWLLNPPAIDDKTAMPNVGLNAAQARDVATYLYSLR